jgi:hypothetical protein
MITYSKIEKSGEKAFLASSKLSRQSFGGSEENHASVTTISGIHHQRFDLDKSRKQINSVCVS